MDGSDRRPSFITNELKLPNSLIVDNEHDDICWTDAGLRRIGMSKP